ncbi:MAG: zinc ribbon domain-containing protein [Dehalococcoidia bacterium]|nr:zinc ribbon domain-containing protein [Dehalococcoidia bacterium]
MPIYEYRCEACGRISNVFVRSVRAKVAATCEHCGGTDLKRLMSRVGRVKSTQDVVDEYGAPRTGEGYRDPRQIGHWVEQRFQDYGMEVPAETREMIDRAREGDLPEDISGV